MINSFRWYCYNILPLVYDPSLSYYEFLCKVLAKLNEVIGVVNDFGEDFKKYTDEQIAILKEYVDQQDAEIYKYVDSENKRQDAETEAKLMLLKQLFQQETLALKDLINSRLDQQQAWLNTQIALIYAEVNRINENGFTIYNPLTGSYQHVGKVVSDVYEALRYCGLTAQRYDSLELTATAYDALSLTAFDYDVYAQCKLYKNPNHYMHSPYTGQYVRNRYVIYENTQQLRVNGLTATAYDALELSADDYTAKDVTSYNYDWTGIPA